MKKPHIPSNHPTLKCAECKGPAPAHETWASDDQGHVKLMAVDIWPTYYRDVLEWRIEFCSAACGLKYMQKKASD